MQDNELMHYGVLGMKWGHRKQRPSSGLQRRRDQGVSSMQATTRTRNRKSTGLVGTAAGLGTLGIAAGLGTLGIAAAVGTIIKKHSNVKMSNIHFSVDQLREMGIDAFEPDRIKF